MSFLGSNRRGSRYLVAFLGAAIVFGSGVVVLVPATTSWNLCATGAAVCLLGAGIVGIRYERHGASLPDVDDLMVRARRDRWREVEIDTLYLLQHHLPLLQHRQVMTVPNIGEGHVQPARGGFAAAMSVDETPLLLYDPAGGGYGLIVTDHAVHALVKAGGRPLDLPFNQLRDVYRESVGSETLLHLNSQPVLRWPAATPELPERLNAMFLDVAALHQHRRDEIARRRLLTLVAACAAEDQISDPVREVLLDLALEWGLPEDRARNLIARELAADTPTVPMPMDPVRRTAEVRDLLNQLLVDAPTSPRETNLLVELASCMGVDRDQMKAVLEGRRYRFDEVGTMRPGRRIRQLLCRRHPQYPVSARCAVCGTFVCDHCATAVGEGILCPVCRRVRSTEV